MKRLFLLFIPLMFFFSCDLLDEEEAMIEWCVEFEISSDLEATYGVFACDNGPLFYFTGLNTSGIIGEDISTGQCCSSHPNDLNELDYSISLADTDEIGCSDIEFRLYKEGDLFFSKSVQMGCLSDPGGYDVFSGVDCDDYCGQYGNSYTFIVDISQ